MPRLTTMVAESLSSTLTAILARLDETQAVDEEGVSRLRELVEHLELMTGAEDILDSEDE